MALMMMRKMMVDGKGLKMMKAVNSIHHWI
jgi:hypothetical protein